MGRLAGAALCDGAGRGHHALLDPRPHAYALLPEEARASVKEVGEVFNYVGQSETTRLSPADYGTTHVSPKYVQEVIRQRGLGELQATYPRLLWNFQDVYTIRKP